MKTILIAAFSLALFLLGSAALADDAPALDKRYSDAMSGFSLRPPAGTERKKETAISCRVSWAKRDADTGAIAWSLKVTRDTDPNEKLDLKEFDKRLAQKLAVDEHLKVDSDKLVKVAGKPAVDISGVGGSETSKLWERQVWVLMSLARPGFPPGTTMPNEGGTLPASTPSLFLVLSMTGPLNLKAQMDQTLSAVLGTLVVTDPDEAIKQLKEAKENGAALLERLSDEKHKVQIALSPESWFLMSIKDKPLGFLKVAQTQSRQPGMEGYEVTTWLMRQVPNETPQLYKRNTFVSGAGSLEHWAEQLQVGSGKDSSVFVQNGMMGDMIADRRQLKPVRMIKCDVGTDTKTKAQRKDLGEVKGIYLPYAYGVLLPKVVDLKQPKSYLFATYVAASNDFDMRTFTVVGPSKVTVAGKEVDAVKITDKPSQDAEPVDMWVNSDGELLRVQNADGSVIERATHEAVLRRNPTADTIITQMAKWTQPR